MQFPVCLINDWYGYHKDYIAVLEFFFFNFIYGVNKRTKKARLALENVFDV